MTDRTLLSPARLRWHAAAAAVGFALVGTGCSNTISMTTALIPYPARLEEADSSISEAVDAYNKGSQGDGDTALTRAVLLLSPPTEGAATDWGFIDVAKRVAMKGRPQDAVRLLEPLTKDNNPDISGDPYVWCVLSSVAKQAGNMPRSEVAATEAQARAAAIMKTVNQHLSKPTDVAAAVQRFERAGEYYDECAKDYPKALLAYREARRLLPNDVETANSLGYELADRGTTPGDFAEAVQLTGAARDADEDNPMVIDSYGWALYKRHDPKQKDVEAARRVLREAVDMAPSVPELRYHLAKVYESLGLVQDADIEAERALVLRPDYDEAKALTEELKAKIAAMPSPSPSPTDTPLPSPSPSASPAPAASPSPRIVT